MTSSTPVKETLKQRALGWLRDNPEARRMFRRYASQMAERNIRFGMKALVERVRWQHLLDYDQSDIHGFKINNSYTAYIARWLIVHDPRLSKLVCCRSTPAANKPARAAVATPDVNPS